MNDTPHQDGLPGLPERDGDWAGDDWWTADSMRKYALAAVAAQPLPVQGEAVAVGEVRRAHYGGRARNIGFDIADLYPGADVRPGDKLYTHPKAQPASHERKPLTEEQIRADERERICVAIKAEDDYCVVEGDYMLDSDDCIKVVRGEWVRPDFGIAATQETPAVERCACGYPMPCSKSVPVGFCRSATQEPRT